jgi:hypothetical protein
LGHGRPLGLGSVAFELDEAVRLCDKASNDSPLPPAPSPVTMVSDDWERALEGLAEFVKRSGNLRGWVNGVFLPWLRVHQYAGRRRFDYPRGKIHDRHGKASTEIFDYHTSLRVNHIGGRKDKSPKHRTRYGLTPLDSL